MSIKDTLHDRGASYGDFKTHAKISQAFKLLLEELCTETEKVLPDYQQEAIQMVFHKLGRVVNGDHMYIDSWRDMVGYLQLVVDIMEQTEGATDCKVTKFTISSETPVASSDSTTSSVKKII